MNFQKNRLKELDFSRGFFILMVSWVHVSFFIGGSSLGEIFYYTTNFPQMSKATYHLWTLSEQLTPAGFFLLMGVSVELSARKALQSAQSRYFLYKRGIFIALLGALIIRPFYLMAPLEKIGDVGPSGLGTYIVVGIFIILGATLIGVTFLRNMFFKLSSRSYSSIALFFGLALLIISGLVEIFDTHIDLYVNSSHVFLQSFMEMLLVSGKTGYFKATFSIFPWLGYALIGIWYGNRVKNMGRKEIKKELIAALLLIVVFFTIKFFQLNARPFWDNLFLMSKYPPSIPLSIICMAYFLFMINIFRLMSHDSKLLMPLEILGKNSLFIYCIHFPFFIILGWGINKMTGRYIENLAVMNIVWFMGMGLLTYITQKFDAFKKSQDSKILKRFLPYF